MANCALIDIPSACARRGYLSTIGVVIDVLPPFQTKGSSTCVTFTLKDSLFDQPHWAGGLKIKYFNDHPDALPVVQVDDVVLLRGIRVTSYNDKPTGVASQHDTVEWAVFRSDPDPNSIPTILTGPTPFPLKPAEEQAARRLLDGAPRQASNTSNNVARQMPLSQQRSQVVQAFMAPTTTKSGLPLRLIRDLQPGPFVQILGQVVKINNFDSERCILHLTDYTSNEALVEIEEDRDEDMGVDGDSFGYLSRKRKNWPGPWGKMTIQAVLWEPHATYARSHVKEGQIVLLTYTRIKPASYTGLEAVVHQDKRYPAKTHVKVVADTDDLAQDLMTRRKAYWKIHGKPSNNTANVSNKKKKRTEAKKQLEQRKTEAPKALSLPAARRGTNPHIKTRAYNVPVRSVERVLAAESHQNEIPGGIIYQLPFQNVYYQIEVRVVDFFPPRLEDFAVQVPMHSIVAPGDSTHQRGEHQRLEWEWRFCLLVEGTEPSGSKDEPRPTMKIYVTGAEADHLLSIDAADLHNDHMKLHELREKLFLLWGDLEELKMKHEASAKTNAYRVPSKPSSVPFKCSIKEYGVPCSHPHIVKPQSQDKLPGRGCSEPNCFGWERRFALFGTAIHT
ncbi:hypothetical protein N7539_003615 [Penicillium diatomitis]|uniref:Protection of telomeres protein 1 n=1 Tax=Penicillium diatomitis TaxID=2819901 RepID=A0A9X0BXG1_9EURO|nr:uncharacterized protein N7539_003615 [Penicillium diatomitis]KAJ5488725.1 hypothetical protein N7539_003615 [Penicillium diatomitis]